MAKRYVSCEERDDGAQHLGASKGGSHLGQQTTHLGPGPSPRLLHYREPMGSACTQ
jgi:hypothetical protein